MNENIDVRISNYLTILGNQELRNKIDSNIVRAMESAVAIYTATTTRRYLDEYRSHQEESERREQITGMFK